MDVTVELVGGDTRDLEVSPEATYVELLDAFEFGLHEVSILVDGRPVPEDSVVESDHVRILRLIKGG